MGREIRRVPLDFSWPLNKVWEGFLNPHYKDCPENDKTCFHGYSAAGYWLDVVARFICTLGADGAAQPLMVVPENAHRRTFPHPYVQQFPTAPYHKDYKRIVEPTPELAELSTGLAGRAPYGLMGHDCIDATRTARKIREAAGLPEEWGLCKVCKGSGQDPSLKEACDAWKPEPPPSGEGWQLWETVSEGSPVSEVYPTEEAFIEYLIGEGYSEAAARAFCKSGYAASAVIVEGGPQAGFYKNIESAVLQDGNEPEKEHGH